MREKNDNAKSFEVVKKLFKKQKQKQVEKNERREKKEKEKGSRECKIYC